MLSPSEITELRNLQMFLVELREDYNNGLIMKVDYDRLRKILLEIHKVKKIIEIIEKKAFN